MSDRKPGMKRKAVATQPAAKAEPVDLVETSFAEVVGLIEQARQRAYQAVNSELVGLYWRIGEYISTKLAAAVWGECVVDSLAQHLARTMPGQRGFTRRNLFRMRQFFEAYCTADKKVTALLTQLPWTHNLIILTQSKRSGGARVLPARGGTGKVDEPRAGAPIQSGHIRACGAQPSKSVGSADTNAWR